MPANTIPIFILTPETTSATISAANTARDGSGTLVPVFTGGTFGSRVDFITFFNAQTTATTSSAMVARVFVTDTAGLNPRLLNEVTLASVAASNTVVGANNTIFYSNGLLLSSGQQIQVSKSVHAGQQDTVQVIVRGGDY